MKKFKINIKKPRPQSSKKEENMEKFKPYYSTIISNDSLKENLKSFASKRLIFAVVYI